MESTVSVPDPVLSFSGLTILVHERLVMRGHAEILLTHLEFSALLYLTEQPGRVFTKEQIYRHVYQEEPAGDIENSIYCLIHGLRKKLELDPRHPKYVATVRGVGYKFAMSPETL